MFLGKNKPWSCGKQRSTYQPAARNLQHNTGPELVCGGFKPSFSGLAPLNVLVRYLRQSVWPYRPHQPCGRALTAPRPRWSRTRWPNTLGTGTFARLASQKPGNEGSAVWLPCWSAATLQCLLSTVGESGGRGDMRRNSHHHPQLGGSFRFGSGLDPG